MRPIRTIHRYVAAATLCIIGVFGALATSCDKTKDVSKPKTEAERILADADVRLNMQRDCDTCDDVHALQNALVQGKTVAIDLAVPKASPMNRDQWFIRPDGSAICYAVRGRGDGTTKTTRYDFDPDTIYTSAGVRVDLRSQRSNCQKILSPFDPTATTVYATPELGKSAMNAALAKATHVVEFDDDCRGCATDTAVVRAMKTPPIGVRHTRGKNGRANDYWLIRADGSATCFAQDMGPNGETWRAYHHGPKTVFKDGQLTRPISEYLFCRRDAPEAAASFVKDNPPDGPAFVSDVSPSFALMRIRGAHKYTPIEDVIWDGLPAFEACHNAQIRQGKRDFGRVNFSWTIAVDGSVKDLVIYDTLMNNALRTCIREAFQSLRFDSPGRIEAYVKVPIEFRVVDL